MGRSEGAALDARPATNQKARRAFKLLQPREPAPGMVSPDGLGRGRGLGAESAEVDLPAGRWALNAAVARPAGGGARVGAARSPSVPESQARGAGRSSVHPETEGSAAERAAADSVGSRYTVTAWRGGLRRREPRPAVVSDFSCLLSNPLGKLMATLCKQKPC